jgi:putative glycerol-1-phosphate prenyltransferase
LGLLSQLESAKSSGQKLIARLIDPDDLVSTDHLFDIAHRATQNGVDFIFFGGSLVTEQLGFDPVKALKRITEIPCVLFPSTPMQINHGADAVLFLSLLSGRNPEYLIGHHVAAAPMLRRSNIEIVPTGYMLVGCGKPTTAEYISHTFPIPYDKPEIAAATALAGQFLGLKLIYLDGGSGAERCISPEMVAMVREWVDVPIIVGGGIRSARDAKALHDAGADLLVVGNGADANPNLMLELKLSRKL